MDLRGKEVKEKVVDKRAAEKKLGCSLRLTTSSPKGQESLLTKQSAVYCCSSKESTPGRSPRRRPKGEVLGGLCGVPGPPGEIEGFLWCRDLMETGQRS